MTCLCTGTELGNGSTSHIDSAERRRNREGRQVRKISMRRIFGFIGLVFIIAIGVVLLKRGVEVAFGIHIPAAVSGVVAGGIGASLLFWSERKR